MASRQIANSLRGRGDLLGFRLNLKVSHHYQPITAILYASRIATVATAIQADKV
jgi:hypothetical protein